MLQCRPLYLRKEEGEKFKEVLIETLTESMFYEPQFIVNLLYLVYLPENGS